MKLALITASGFLLVGMVIGEAAALQENAMDRQTKIPGCWYNEGGNQICCAVCKDNLQKGCKKEVSGSEACKTRQGYRGTTIYEIDCCEGKKRVLMNAMGGLFCLDERYQPTWSSMNWAMKLDGTKRYLNQNAKDKLVECPT